MRATDFTSDSPGIIKREPHGYNAFVPHPLPPQIEWDADLTILNGEAERMVGILNGVGNRLPNPYLIIQPFMNREAVLSSRIEGTQAGYSDLLYFEARPVEKPQIPDVREVHNYVRALAYGLDRIGSLPLSLRLTREIHSHLMDGVRGDHLTPGEFRKTPNWIGPPGATLNNATFVPPPPQDLMACLGDLETHLHVECQLPPLIRIALVHYQFEAIHPFLDGNGRVGRLLITLLLSEWNLLSRPLLYLSNHFEKSRDQYYSLLLGVSQRGCWRDWISYFLRGVIEQAADATGKVDRLLALRDDYQHRVRIPAASALLGELVDLLFKTPAVTTARVADELNTSVPTAQNCISHLEEKGILQEITGQRRNRIYCATEIVEMVETP